MTEKGGTSEFFVGNKAVYPGLILIAENSRHDDFSPDIDRVLYAAYVVNSMEAVGFFREFEKRAKAEFQARSGGVDFRWRGAVDVAQAVYGPTPDRKDLYYLAIDYADSPEEAVRFVQWYEREVVPKGLKAKDVPSDARLEALNDFMNRRLQKRNYPRGTDPLYVARDSFGNGFGLYYLGRYDEAKAAFQKAEKLGLSGPAREWLDRLKQEGH